MGVQKIEILNIYIPFGDTIGSGFGSAIGVSMRNFVGLIQSARDLCLCLSLQLTGPLQLYLCRLCVGFGFWWAVRPVTLYGRFRCKLKLLSFSRRNKVQSHGLKQFHGLVIMDGLVLAFFGFSFSFSAFWALAQPCTSIFFF